MGEQRYQNNEIVVDCARIGCTYAQPRKNKQIAGKDNWNEKFLRIYHSYGEKENGCEVAHNHDCVPITNIPNFERCYSPYYTQAVEALSVSCPEKKQIYDNALEKARSMQGSECLLELLDTWFEYSDVQISKDYASILAETHTYILNFYQDITNLYKWCKKQIAAQKAIELEEIVKKAPVVNGYPVIDNEVYKPLEKYDGIQRRIDVCYKEVNTEKKKLEEYWDRVLIYGADYYNNLSKIGTTIRNYLRDWKEYLALISVDIKMYVTSDNVSYYNTIDNIAQKAMDVSSDLRTWETEAEYELLTSSFLVCKCGGRIEFITSGQEHMLYCGQIFNQLRNLIANTANHLQTVLDSGLGCWGVTREQCERSLTSARNTLTKIHTSFSENTKFTFDKDTLGVQIKLITRGYNKEKQTKSNALLGMLVFAPVSVIAAAVSVEATVAVSVGILLYDAYNIENQSDEDKKENRTGDGTTLYVDLTSAVTGTLSTGIESGSVRGLNANAVSALGNAATAAAFVLSFNNLFYTSEDDWIQDIEIVVFTEYMAHIVKQKYTKEAEPEVSFDGAKMVQGKSKKDYCNETLPVVNWNELGGLSVETQKDARFINEKHNSEKADDSEAIMRNIGIQTNGG